MSTTPAHMHIVPSPIYSFKLSQLSQSPLVDQLLNRLSATSNHRQTQLASSSAADASALAVVRASAEAATASVPATSQSSLILSERIRAAISSIRCLSALALLLLNSYYPVAISPSSTNDSTTSERRFGLRGFSLARCFSINVSRTGCYL